MYELNNSLTHDSEGYIEIPFHAHITAKVQWSAVKTETELFEEARTQINDKTPNWEIDDATLSDWQGQPALSGLDKLIQEIETLSDFAIVEDSELPDCFIWKYRCDESERKFVTRWECLSHFILRHLQDLDELTGIDEEDR